MKRAPGFVAMAAAAGAAAGGGACTQHKVEVAPIEVRPIHMTVDVNIKVDRELDQFFAFEEELAASGEDATGADPAAAPQAPAGTRTPDAPQTQGAQP